MRAALVLALLPFVLMNVTLAADFSGPVVSVLDGDTIEVLHNKNAKRVRLQGINCPEKRQPYGIRAKQAASAVVFEKEVTLQAYGKDGYERTLAGVFLPDGTTLD